MTDSFLFCFAFLQEIFLSFYLLNSSFSYTCQSSLALLMFCDAHQYRTLTATDIKVQEYILQMKAFMIDKSHGFSAILHQFLFSFNLFCLHIFSPSNKVTLLSPHNSFYLCIFPFLPNFSLSLFHKWLFKKYSVSILLGSFIFFSGSV